LKIHGIASYERYSDTNAFPRILLFRQSNNARIEQLAAVEHLRHHLIFAARHVAQLFVIEVHSDRIHVVLVGWFSPEMQSQSNLQRRPHCITSMKLKACNR